MANYITEFFPADELWFVVSPHNPLKSKTELADFNHRLCMVKQTFEKLKLPVTVSDIEETLPQPSYTINTLDALSEQYPNKKWQLLVGSDNLEKFHKWHNFEKIIDKYQLLVYPRLGFQNNELCEKYKVIKLNAPIIEISSTFIRENISKAHNLSGFLPCGVYEYIKKFELYED